MTITKKDVCFFGLIWDVDNFKKGLGILGSLSGILVEYKYIFPKDLLVGLPLK